MLGRGIPRVELGAFPTPLRPLENLSRHLGGARILVKRDDLTGLATGGNKTRKLEYLLADALAQGADTIITTGGPQSNHARQTAAAAAAARLGCVLVLSSRAPSEWAGNLLLDSLLGARIRWTGDREAYQVMEEVAEEERAASRVPYIIPAGGSNPIGASAYAVAMDELVRQVLAAETRIDHVVVASGSGGTQAGLLVGAGALNYTCHVLGISVAASAQALRENILGLARMTAAFLDLRLEIDLQSVDVSDAYLGGGYGVLGEPEREAIKLVARQEGLLLDPVYTGRAMAGLLDMIREKRFSSRETVLFWHTGGLPALFAYGDELLAR